MATKEIKTLPNGEQFIEFSDEEMLAVGWFPGDTIKWTPNEDGSYTLTKVEKKEETELVLVDTILTYRIRYCVEVPKGKAEWALDTVTCEEAKEFSQKCLGETIVSHRTITKEEAIELSREDNDYCNSWSDDQHLNTFITLMKEDDEK